MKKKNGFTLVELLVVIALMLSILGIAIVSFVNISNKKKEESWKEVVNQIETAAKDYFSSNEYLFEGLPNNNGTAQISLGKLVNEDYLNVVSDPRSEKRVSKCAIVTVKKNDDKYNVELDENSLVNTETDCDSNLTVITSETGRIEDTYNIDADKMCKDKDNSEYSNISEEEKERICKCHEDPSSEECSGFQDEFKKILQGRCLDAKGNEINNPEETSGGYCHTKMFKVNLENIKGSITSAKYCNVEGFDCEPDEGNKLEFNPNSKESKEFEGYGETTETAHTRVDVYNQSGGVIRFFNDYSIDRTEPVINNFSISRDSSYDYNTNRPTISVNVSDEDSNLHEYSFDNASDSEGNKEFDVDAQVDEDEIYENAFLYSGGSQLPNLKRADVYVTLTVSDRVGNETKSEPKHYDIYGECDETEEKRCKHWYYYDCNCSTNKGKTVCDTCSDYYYDYSYWDKYTAAYCSGVKSCGNTRVPTTKPKVTTPKKACSANLIKEKVAITSTVYKKRGNECYSYGENVFDISKATYVKFKIKISDKRIKKVESHAAFCADEKTCNNVTTSNPGQTKVTCTKNTNCKSYYKYVGMSVKFKCGDKTYTKYYSAPIK